MYYSQKRLSKLEKFKDASWLWDVERSQIIWANKAGIKFWHEEILFDLIDRKFNNEIADSHSLNMTKKMLIDGGDDSELIREFSFFPNETNENSKKTMCKCSLLELNDGRIGVLLVELADRQIIMDKADENNNASYNGNFYEAIYNLNPQELGVFNLNGSLLFSNDAFKASFNNGVNDEDDAKTSKLNLGDILADKEKASSIINRTVEHGGLNIGLRLNTKYGARWHRVRSKLINFKDKEHVLITLHDQEDRRLLEKGILADNEKLSELVACSTDFTWKCDGEGDITEISDRFCELADISKDEIISQNWLYIFDIKKIIIDEQELMSLFSGKQQWRSPAILMEVVEDDEVKNYQLILNASPIWNDKGEFGGYCGSGIFYGRYKRHKAEIITEHNDEVIDTYFGKDLDAESKDLDANSKDLGAESKDLDAESKDLDAKSKDLETKSYVATEVPDDSTQKISKVVEISDDKENDVAITQNALDDVKYLDIVADETDKASDDNRLDSIAGDDKRFDGNLDKNDKSVFKSIGKFIKGQVDEEPPGNVIADEQQNSIAEQSDEIEDIRKFEKSADDVEAKKKSHKVSLFQDQEDKPAEENREAAKQLIDDPSKEDHKDAADTNNTETDDVIEDEVAVGEVDKSHEVTEFVPLDSDEKAIKSGSDDFLLFITHGHYKNSKHAILLHRNFEILDTNEAFVKLMGFANIDEVISKRNLISLFPNDKMRLFNLQSKLENWREVKASSSSNKYEFKLSYQLEGGEVLKLLASARQAMWNNEKIIYMSFVKDDEIKDVDISCDKSQESIVRLESDNNTKPNKIFDNKLFGIRSSKSNIIEQTISAELNNLQNVMDEVGEGIIIFEQGGKIIQSNLSAEKLLNDSYKIINLNLFDILSDDVCDELRAKMQASKETEKGVAAETSVEFDIENKQNERRDLILNLAHSKDNVNNYSAIIHDISRWKKAEQELRDARANAEDESMKKSDMLARISHEIRTPLNSILGFSEVMSTEQFGPIVNDRYKEYVGDIKSSSELLLNLINNLLDLSKVEMGKMELNFKSVNLRDLIRSISNMVSKDASDKKLLMRINIADELPDVVADEMSIKQVMLNLLTNAIKYTDTGGQVIISAKKNENGEVSFSVRDSGVGMDGDDLKLAMEPYRRIEASKHNTIRGTGLGLPLTKALVGANRASFEISSEKEVGTLVSVTFPTNRVLEY